MKSKINVDTELNDLRKFFINKISLIDLSKIKSINNSQVSLPVRLNLSAGWNDTPPYSHEQIGSTLNTDFLLNKKKPITTTITSLKKNIIVLESEGSKREEINSIEQLLECDRPDYNNAIVKASIFASGIIPMSDVFDLNNLLIKTGGFKIKCQTKNIPIGSGLGTSSIIIASIIKALYKSLNLSISDNDLYIRVATAEQILGTGGGYQDQIGAIIPGMKLIKFYPQKKDFPVIDVDTIKLSPKTKKYLNNKLEIIYTGKTRLAKNILKNVMGNYIIKDKTTIDVLKEINNVAMEMKNNIEKDDLESFGQNMIKSYELCKRMYSSFTNADIEKIIEKVKDKCYGYMIAGAGGGGYLIVLYK